MEETPVVFEDWDAVLRAEVRPALRPAYREAITKFRYWLRQTDRRATVETFKEHLAWKKSYLPPEKYALRLAALRWYYRRGSKRMEQAGTRVAGAPGGGPRPAEPSGASCAVPLASSPHRSAHSATDADSPADPTCRRVSALVMKDVPTRGDADLGGPPWERELVRRIRERNLAWESEKTYRIL